MLKIQMTQDLDLLYGVCNDKEVANASLHKTIFRIFLLRIFLVLFNTENASGFGLVVGRENIEEFIKQMEEQLEK